MKILPVKKLLASFALLLAVKTSYADIDIDNVYIPQAPPAAMAHAAYLTLSNSGDEPRTLVGVSSPSYGMVHLHHTMIKDGTSSMKAMDEIMIEPGQTIMLEPGGMHIMLMKPEQEATVAGKVPLKFMFKNGETIVVTALVRAIN